jgi:aminoglycoside phosphotransferase (APT) family kinase protein
VFKVGDLVVKIFAPKESGFETESDYQTELFGIARANRLGVSAPQLLASGRLEDKYEFPYLVMEYISGEFFDRRNGGMTDGQKREFAQQLRTITDRLNTPCERFNGHDVVKRALACKRWCKFPASFQAERHEYLRNYKLTDPVYVHGDLTSDNVLINARGQLYIIDFADAVLAPVEYELASIICQVFSFEGPYLDAYFGEYGAARVAEQCFVGLLLHEFGAEIIWYSLGEVAEMANLAVLLRVLFTFLAGNDFSE